MTPPRPLRYRGLLAAARLTLLWEAAWPRLWPVLGVGGAFLALAMLDVLPRLPGWLHVVVLLAFAAALVVVAVCSWRAVPRIGRDAARHRLERDSGLAHRPLTALEDTLAGGDDDAGARALWRLHLESAAAAVGRLRLGAPAPETARADPYGLRILVVMVLVIAVAGGSETGARLTRAVTPDFSGAPPGPIAVDLWVTPPAYTLLPPVFLRAGTADARPPADASAPESLHVPKGSAVLAQVTGGPDVPVLDLGVRDEAFAALGDDAPTATYRIETGIGQATRLAVVAGRRRIADWPVHVVPDTVPSIAFVETPKPDASSYLSFHYTAEDDYGLVDVTAVVRRTDGSRALDGATEIRLPLLLSDPGGGLVEGGGAHDLTAHVWAGHAATIHLEATDAIGQVGRSEPATLVLPERTFTHPVAIAIIEQRKRLLADADAARLEVSRALRAIAGTPDAFAHDTVVSLGLAVAGARLIHERSAAAIPTVRDLLWNVALRLEKGTVPVAEQRLREAQERLAEALRSERDPAVVDRLMRDLQEALAEYMKALAAELARRGEILSELPADARQVRPQDLMDLIETARTMAQSGAMDAARQLLSELQRMLDAMRNGLENNAQAQQLVEANQLMNALRDLAGQQQDLLDRTFRELQRMRAAEERPHPGTPPGGPPQDDGGEQARGEPADGDAGAEQEALRRELGELMLRSNEILGGIPAPLGFAERAMKGASDALGAGRPGDAVPQQTEAVRQLQKATEEAAQMMSQQLGGLSGMFGAGSEPGSQPGLDPFGRSGLDGDRGFGIEAVDIPDRMKIRRVEEILRELRRRAGESGRPRSELDYIERLLRRF